MAIGKVISFDEFRGFGFIAPDGGGEDVFMHVNDLDSDKRLISVDAQVEFMVENGGKGLKASHVRVLDRHSAPKVTLVSPPPPSPAPKTTPTPATIAAMVSPGPAVATLDRQANDTGFCDVLSVKEFTREITEAVLAAVPTMTAQQILGVRECLVGLAQTHSWVDG
ncbi:cold shock domain-containing protein [Acrocarpospora macrocephala]|uniref:DNA-binding protein n=1 Tax=Acrocarpospora macrocephala TaxID=150177 RepID=A0A5M3WVT2_9ACTN|nr:cold shock domain-containing protein [Acrocarpospora macrocephala]GES10258.1 DNA-binding protein [Acrocarpospora macrocephala]